MLSEREVTSTLNMLRNEHLDVRTVTPVSYTHLDVYKRQSPA